VRLAPEGTPMTPPLPELLQQTCHRPQNSCS
jgi:hypothetical protein